MFGSYFSSFRWTPISVFSAAIFIAFIAQSVESVWLHSSILTNFGALSSDGLKNGHLWQLFSYTLLHGGLWHMIFNLLALLLIGWPLEAEIGKRAMGFVLVLLTLGGGLAFCAAHLADGGTVMGASAVGVGLLTLYCLSYPERPITLLLFFVLPITLTPKWILVFTLVVNLFGFAFGEIAPGGVPIGYSAHLGGMLAAWIISRWCFRTYDSGVTWGTAPPVTPKRKAASAPAGVQPKVLFKGQKNYQVDFSSRAQLQQEVDRILDKINIKGFGSLNKSEKETLDKAKDILGK